MNLVAIFFLAGSVSGSGSAAVAPQPALNAIPTTHLAAKSLKERLQERMSHSPKHQTSLIFDLPLTYNKKVSFWIQYFQTRGSTWFGQWIEKSTKYLPLIQKELKNQGLPQDLAYMVMIESGFDSQAESHASAVGPWQFIPGTGQRYGLRINYWLDERRDLKKSTLAASRYIRDLYREFGSWYLVAASYNMGENGLRRQIQKYKTNDYWTLSNIGALPDETINYVPKILAALLIAKSPSLYGFDRVTSFEPLDYEIVFAPGGTDIQSLADHLQMTPKALRELNSELKLGYIPQSVRNHPIRVPKGSMGLVSQYFHAKFPHRSLTQNESTKKTYVE